MASEDNLKLNNALSTSYTKGENTRFFIKAPVTFSWF